MLRTKADLTKDGILKSLLIFALPILVSNIFQQLYNTADTVIVGNILGESALAAVGACSVVYEMLIGLALSVGLTILSQMMLMPLLRHPFLKKQP